MTEQQVVRNNPVGGVPPPRRGRGITPDSARVVALGVGCRVRLRSRKPATVRSIARYWSVRLGRSYVTRIESPEVVAVWRVS